MLSRKVEELNPWEFAEMIEENGEGNILVVDVREMDEFLGEMGHIRGSINIPIKDLPAHMREFMDRKKLAFVCNTGDRSYFACRYLMDNGINHVVHLKGGIVQWHLSGLEVEYE